MDGGRDASFRKGCAGNLHQLPPGKTYEEKKVLGIYRDWEALSGVADVVENYPEDGVWTIGLLLIDPEERGHGLGKSVHHALMEWASGLGAETFQIGVLEENEKAFPFWSSLGYAKCKEVSMQFKEKTHTVNVMTLKIT